MKALRSLVVPLLKIKNNSKLNKDDMTKLFIMGFLIVSAMLEIIISISNTTTVEISVQDYKILMANTVIFWGLVIVVFSID